MTKNQKLSLAIILIVGFILHLLAINYALPVRFFGDEYVHLANSLKMLEQKTLFLDFSYLPPLYAYLLMPFILLYGLIGIIFGSFEGLAGFKEYVILNSENLLVFPRLLAVIFGSLMIYFTFLWAKKLFNLSIAWWSAAIMTFLPLVYYESQVGRFWLPVGFFILAAAYFAYQLYLEGKAKWYFWTVMMVGLGFGMGYVAILMILWFFLSQLLRCYQKQQKILNRNFIFSNLVLIGLLLFFILGNTFSFLRQFGRGLSTLLQPLGLSFTVPQVDAYYIDNNFFDVVYQILIALWHNYYYLVILIIIGLILLIKNKTYWQDGRNYFLIALPVIYLLGLALVFNEIINRYVVPALPFLTIILAVGCDWLIKKIKIKSWAIVFLMIILLLPQLYFVISYSVKLLKADTFSLAKQWIEENIAANTALVLDSQYFYLNPSQAALEFQQQNNKKFLDTRSQLLLTLTPERYPQPSYLIYNLEHLDEAKINPASFIADYFIVSYYKSTWQLEDLSLERQQLLSQYDFELIKAFYPVKENDKNIELKFIQNDLTDSLRQLSKLQRFGPKIAIYKLINR